MNASAIALTHLSTCSLCFGNGNKDCQNSYCNSEPSANILQVNRLTRTSASERKTHIQVMSVQQSIATRSWAPPALSCCLELQPSCGKDRASVANIPVPIPSLWQTLCNRACICGVHFERVNVILTCLMNALCGFVDTIHDTHDFQQKIIRFKKNQTRVKWPLKYSRICKGSDESCGIRKRKWAMSG